MPNSIWLTIKVEKGNESVIGVYNDDDGEAKAIALGKKLVGECCIPEFMIQEWTANTCSSEFDEILSERIAHAKSGSEKVPTDYDNSRSRAIEEGN